MVAIKNHFERKMNCEGSRNNAYTFFITPENSIFLAQSKNKVIGDIHFLSAVNTLPKYHMQNVTKRGVLFDYVHEVGLLLFVKRNKQVLSNSENWNLKKLKRL